MVDESRPTEIESSVPMLGQNAPNPFNSQTTIELHVPTDYMTLDIFNLRGQRVYSTAIPRGTNQIIWEGTNQRGFPVASGVYIYRLRGDNRIWATKRMVLIR